MVTVCTPSGDSTTSKMQIPVQLRCMWRMPSSMYENHLSSICSGTCPQLRVSSSSSVRSRRNRSVTRSAGMSDTSQSERTAFRSGITSVCSPEMGLYECVIGLDMTHPERWRRLNM